MEGVEREDKETKEKQSTPILLWMLVNINEGKVKPGETRKKREKKQGGEG